MKREEKTPERIAYLIAGFLRNTLTETEHRELDRWVEASEENMRLFEVLTDEKNIAASLECYAQKEQDAAAKQAAYEQIKQQAGISKKRSMVVRLLPYAVAAVLILAAGFWFLHQEGTKTTSASLAQQQQQVVPGKDQAVLTLSNGRKVVLDSATGPVGEGATVQADLLVYDAVSARADQYNVLTVPRGGQYKVILPDGSAVWLNAESELRYPLRMDGRERRVALRGEAYFDVKRQKNDAAFIVSAEGMDIAVLGTQFNVQAYVDEKHQQTTLVEGKVSVRTAGKEKILKPGEQATIMGGGIRVGPADLAKTIAWKNGLFVFRDASMASIASQLKRWYDVDVKFEGVVDDLFSATIKRDEGLERLLRILEGTGNVHFELRGRSLSISP